MKVPVVQGIIDRRILINYQVEPDILAKILPPPFEPKLIKGVGIAGVSSFASNIFAPGLFRLC